MEIWDETDREWVQGWGKLRTDYSQFDHSRQFSKSRGRPLLFSITREEVLQDPASIAAPQFLYTPPRLQFPQGAQELLSGAMEGLTDVALARVLHISVPPVKMRWRAIYNRV